jgi:hypothetical protein
VREVDFDALEADSDVYALAVDRVVSVSPLTIDLTAKVNLAGLQGMLAAANLAHNNSSLTRDHDPAKEEQV